MPPDQSATQAEQAASASSGSLALSARVTLVRRVPNRNEWTRFRASVTAWRKCRNSRVYSPMEPEMSSSATIGGGRVLARPRYLRSISAPPAFMLARNVRRMSTAARAVGHEPARRAPHRAAAPCAGSPPWRARSRRPTSGRNPCAAAPRDRIRSGAGRSRFRAPPASACPCGRRTAPPRSRAEPGCGRGAVARRLRHRRAISRSR